MLTICSSFTSHIDIFFNFCWQNFFCSKIFSDFTVKGLFINCITRRGEGIALFMNRFFFLFEDEFCFVCSFPFVLIILCFCLYIIMIFLFRCLLYFPLSWDLPCVHKVEFFIWKLIAKVFDSRIWNVVNLPPVGNAIKAMLCTHVKIYFLAFI